MRRGFRKIIAAGAMALMCMINTSLCAFNVSAEWKTEDGKKYYTEDNKRVKGFHEIKGKTYYFDKNGYMAKGWLTYKGSKYYFGKDGVMKTGWVTFKDGLKYYFRSNGKMAKDCTLTINGKKYIFDENGRSASYVSTGNSSPAEFVNPEFGDSVKKVLKECGISNAVKLSADSENGMVIYSGYVIVEGEERIIDLAFNSKNELFMYQFLTEGTKKDFNDAAKLIKKMDPYNKLPYTYKDGVHTWYVSDTVMVCLEYDGTYISNYIFDTSYVY